MNFIDRWQSNIQKAWGVVALRSWANDVHMIWPFTSRPQLWLTCTQLAGVWTTVNSESSTFGHQIAQDLLFSFCENTFDDGNYNWSELASSVNAIERTFGGTMPRVSRVLYTNGELDARAPFGVLRSDGVVADDDVLVIPGCGQSADLYEIRQTDSADLVLAKQRVVQVVKGWL